MELQSETQSFLATVQAEAESVRAVMIFNDDELRQYSESLRSIKTRLKELTELRLSMTRPLDESKKSIMGLFAPVIEKMEGAERTIKAAMVEYESSVAEQRRKEQEEADRRAQEIEQARKQEFMEKAQGAMEDGRQTLAETYVKKANEFHVTPINVAASKRPGVAMRSIWKFRIVDAAKIPREYLVPDEVKIGAIVRAMKGEGAIEGIEMYEEKVVSGRSL